ncbi:transposase [Nitrosomonas communis]|uniref:transposase n=1 Tax=Nitrosomonas communis TaxID=44574 RepID=UPI0009F4E980
MKRSQDRDIRTHTGRQRLNINGAINTISLQAIVRNDDTLNAQSTIQLFQQIEAHHRAAAYIHLICDHARYYRSQLIRDYLNDSKIKLVFLPPSAPHLNLIERYWKFFKKKILYGRYYSTTR